MRRGAALLFVMACLAAPASAQVRVNPGALDALTPSAPTPSAPTRKPDVRKPDSQKPDSAKSDSAKPGAAKPAQPANRSTPERPGKPDPKAASKPPAGPKPAAKPGPSKPAAVPVAPPPNPAIPPPTEVPVQRPPPPPPVPVVPDAPGEADKIPSGLRITFGTARADLNPATEAALRSFARVLKGDDRVNARLNAYAAGNADDQSTPRRLSLSRALAARAVLISEGIISTRIYVYALGAAPAADDAPADRVDAIEIGAPDAPPP